jgi:glycosyl transferase family 2
LGAIGRLSRKIRTYSEPARVKLIVMIPAYNEEETIASVVREIPRSFDGISSVEVLLCDDGSRDRTVEEALAAGVDHVARLRRNFGLTTAFSMGLQAALALGADIIVNTDADGQYDPTEIADLVAPILRGDADMVSGNRQVSELNHMSSSKKYGNRLGSWMLRAVASSPVQDASSGFRAFSRECALRLNPFIGHTYTHQTLIQAAHSGMVVMEVPVTFRPSAREGGKSRLIGGVGSHIMKSLGTIVRSLTTYRPMAVLGRLGVLFIVVAAALGLIPLVAWIQQGNTEGHIQSLVAAVALALVGLQLLVLGLLADAVSTTRRLTEEVLFLVKSEHIGEQSSLPKVKSIHRNDAPVPRPPIQAAVDRDEPARASEPTIAGR